MSDLLDQQERLKADLEEMTVAMAGRDAEIARLKATLHQGMTQGPGSEDTIQKENVDLKAHVALTVENKSLTSAV